jgi:adenylate cyclase
MMLTINKLKIKSGLPKILILSAFWGFAGAVFTINEYFSIRHFSEGINISTDNEYNFLANFLITILVAAFGGLMMGSTDVFYFQKKFRKYSFGKALFIKSIFYSSGLIILIFIGSILYNTKFAGRSLFNLEAYSNVFHHMFSAMFWSQVIVWSIVIIISQFVLQVSDKFGKGILIQMMLGKYHSPKIEERIFMFLDLKSSTTIAEKLRHEKYFELLNDFFNDAADPIIINTGEVYQYVGDEITISWKTDKGDSYDNCIHCFFGIKDAILDSSKKYELKYGLVPEFKAGAHKGEVIVGEVGGYKKEIVFSGDVLNTASRIQSECNRLNQELLVSSELLKHLNINDNGYSFTKIEELKLKGKENSTTIYSVRKL